MAGVYADGGHNGDPAPTEGDSFGGIVAVRTRMIMSHLHQIPNEPAIFYAEKPPKYRSEDGLIAYAWSHFINDTSKPEWLPRLPMVKSVIKAMDAIAQFAASQKFATITKFLVAGASKRGWTTWLTPAVDDRIVAIIPIVMPMLNMVKVINKLWRSLGLWSFALDDYQKLHLMDYLNTPHFQDMADIIDPMVYYNSLARIPKWLITATGDEFFIPDAPREFWRQVPGPKYLRVIPNCEHSLAGHDYYTILQISEFINRFLNNTLPPTLDYSLIYSNTTATITVKPGEKPASVTMWQATTLSKTRRDFRLFICADITNPKCFQPVWWLPQSLSPRADGSYSASINAPSEGWIGFEIEVEYRRDNDPDHYFEVTSEVNIVPDMYPYPQCGGGNGCN